MFMDTLVNESYEYLIEYQNTIHDLDMKMIKCEHVAIVNEDSNMMMLAEEEYKNNIQAALKAIWNKIVITIQNFIIAINKVIAKFRSKFKVSSSFKNQARLIIAKNLGTEYKDDDYNATSKKLKEDKNGNLRNTLKMTNLRVIYHPDKFEKTIVEALNGLNGNFTKDKAQEIYQKLNSFNPENSIVTEKISKEDANAILNAFDIIDSYSEGWIRALEHAKREAQNKAKLIGSKNINDTTEATYFQRIINKCILLIQKVISDCFRICGAVKNIYDLSNVDRINVKKFEPKTIGTKIRKNEYKL